MGRAYGWSRTLEDRSTWWGNRGKCDLSILETRGFKTLLIHNLKHLVKQLVSGVRIELRWSLLVQELVGKAESVVEQLEHRAHNP